MNYLVPEYYKNFKCKCEGCRHSCCEGWSVNITLQEYYRLLGHECSQDLRKRLDCALNLRPYPSNECYAQISSDWLGICMLHREDGLCALQAELGESFLPEVCRFFPRSLRQLANTATLSCSGSCEAVVELLMNIKSTLLFEEIFLPHTPKFVISITDNKYRVCKESIQMLQNRSFSLSKRLYRLGSLFHIVDSEYTEPNRHSLAFRLLFQLDKLYGDNPSIGDYIRISQSFYDTEGKENLSDKDLVLINERRLSATGDLKRLLPDLELIMEQLLVNHMFHNSFPYTEPHNKTEDAYLSLVITYAFLRFHLLGIMFRYNSNEYPVDYFAAMFRVIEHSDFKSMVISLFKQEKYPTQDTIHQLLTI